MNDLIEGTRVEGTMTLDGNDIYAEGVDPVDLRRRVGMIFLAAQPVSPNPSTRMSLLALVCRA